jgi:hypothetical protein
MALENTDIGDGTFDSQAVGSRPFTPHREQVTVAEIAVFISRQEAKVSGLIRVERIRSRHDGYETQKRASVVHLKYHY